MSAATPRPHPGDLLSAYVDGELTDAEQAEVGAHLEQCASCRRALQATRLAKGWVAGLPEVLAPFGFFERMLLDPSGPRRRRERWALRVGAVSLAATASIWLAVVGLTGLTGNRPGGVPALNSLVRMHDEPTAEAEAPSPDAPQRAAALGLPVAIGSYDLQSVVDAGEAEQATYRDGGDTLSVFVYVGYDILERRLPPGTPRGSLGGWPAWVVEIDGERVVLAQVGPNAIVMVGSDPATPSVAEGADGLEPRDAAPSVMDRVQGAGEGLLEAFGLG